MLLCCALVAATTLLAKALGRSLDGAPGLHPLQVAAGRFVFAFLAVLPLALWRRPALRGTPYALHAGRTVAGWAASTLLFAAAAVIPLADATAIGFLSPLIAMLLAIPLLGERVGPWRWAAAGVALAGAMVLIRPGTQAFQAAALLALASACCMGLELILIKRLSIAEPALRMLAVNNAMGTALSLAAALLVWQSPSPRQWLLLAALGVTMVSAQSLLIQAMRRGEASYVVPFFYATLVFAALYDLAAFGVVPSGWSVLGAALIVAGALLQTWREARRREAGG